VPEVQVRRRRVKTCLDPQWLTTLEFLNQFSLNQNLFRTTLDQRQLLFNRLHDRTHDHSKTKGDQPYKIADKSQVLPDTLLRQDHIATSGVASLAIWLYFIQLLHNHHFVCLFLFIFKVKKAAYDLYN
jgi:hypothetical protein